MRFSIETKISHQCGYRGCMNAVSNRGQLAKVPLYGAYKSGLRIIRCGQRIKEFKFGKLDSKIPCHIGC